MNKKNVFISIIIPIYNAEKYLQECLNSILNQSYKDFECLLINDGSIDCSKDICEEFIEKDCRFILFNQENSGVSAARNLGLNKSRGEYIVFVDSDDMVSESYLANLMIDKLSDLVVTGLIRKKETYDEVLKPIITDNYPSVILDLETKKLLSGPCQKRYRKSIIEQHKIRFDNKICHGEDTLFVLEYLLKSESISSYPKADYIYNIQENVKTLSKTRVSFDYSYRMTEMRIDVLNSFFKDDNLRNKYKKLINIIIQTACFSSLYTLFIFPYSKNIRKKELREFYQKRMPFKYDFKNNKLRNLLSLFLYKLNITKFSYKFYEFLFLIMR